MSYCFICAEPNPCEDHKAEYDSRRYNAAKLNETIRDLAEALEQYTKVVQSVNNPDSFAPDIADFGHYARSALTKHAATIKAARGE